eukprot:3678080-Rhodomonas_salina.1
MASTATTGSNGSAKDEGGIPTVTAVPVPAGMDDLDVKVVRSSGAASKVKAKGCRKRDFSWTAPKQEEKKPAAKGKDKEASKPKPAVPSPDQETLFQALKAVEAEGILSKILPASVAKTIPTSSASDLSNFLASNVSPYTLRLRAHLFRHSIIAASG